MSGPSTHSHSERPATLFLAIAFILLLWLPTIDACLHFDHASSFNEKRPPAQFPQLPTSLAGTRQFLSGLEAWFNDHFGCRKRLISWHNQLQRALSGTRTDVMLGEDDWLYFDENHELAAYYEGISRFSPEELLALKTTQERRRDWLAQRGIDYLFVVAPDKQSIYPEHLPTWLKPMGHHTKLDQFFDYMRCHSTVKVIDLRPVLCEAKRIAPTYNKTDSHWNSFGAFVAAQEILKHLNTPEIRPFSEPLSLDLFEMKTTKFNTGDLVSLLGVYGEEQDVAMLPKALPPLVQSIDIANSVVPTFFTTNSYAQGTCLVFRDCFGPALIPFLGHGFETVVYSWSPGGLEACEVEEDKPNVVISEIVERHLNPNR